MYQIYYNSEPFQSRINDFVCLRIALKLVMPMASLGQKGLNIFLQMQNACYN